MQGGERPEIRFSRQDSECSWPCMPRYKVWLYAESNEKDSKIVGREMGC